MLSIVIGVAAAWLVCRSDVPFRRFFGMLLVLPLAIPDFVAGYAWVSLDPAIHGFSGAVLVTTFAYYPLRLPAGRGDAVEARPGARGGRPQPRARAGSRSFRRLVLPQLRLAILGGCIVDRTASARGVRRLLDPPLPDVHDRDLRRIQPRLQRRQRLAALARSRS